MREGSTCNQKHKSSWGFVPDNFLLISVGMSSSIVQYVHPSIHPPINCWLLSTTHPHTPVLASAHIHNQPWHFSCFLEPENLNSENDKFPSSTVFGVHEVGSWLGEQWPKQWKEVGLIYAGAERRVMGRGHNDKRRQRGQEAQSPRSSGQDWESQFLEQREALCSFLSSIFV